MLYTNTNKSLYNPTQELDLESCTVLIYGHLSFMQVLWNDRASEKDYKANVLQVLQIVTRLKIKYILSDAHRLQHTDNNYWFLQVCVPILVKSSISKVARIVPYNPTAITQNQKLVEEKEFRARSRPLAFDFEVFTDLDDAFHWLEIKLPARLVNY
ncbi:hypothetical protein AAE02nite_46790 [Adhaeribacter aerolatus]|uniref:Uncharacterized protein n=1 Tax=Adhaeribacter aerolatus TaxID=670289 RepID=A0A512B4V2_9BACT|nr:hypothetical protein [Adhaeribacter aerolatus]GEO07015.1 hypothetical protein AAE02nite_46790 [Adhaeribacter aerolatus]